MIGRPVANARMYGVAPGAVAAWRALFGHVADRSGVALEILDHAFPAPLAALWARPDLGCAFMCGWPFVRGVTDVVPVAAPVIDDPRAEGRPVYWTDLVVLADDPARSLEDLRGRIVAYTVEDSQSGFNAVRHFLRGVEGKKPIFAAAFGPVFTPRRSIEAVISGDADAGPVDSYAYALLQLHAPELTDRVRIIARTAPTPCPLLVASAGLDAGRLGALREAFVNLHDDDRAQGLLAPLALRGFAEPLPRDAYFQMERDAADAEMLGIHRVEVTP
jgi:ABC-type phosphate/phosphonate transport system substrate-binding protein